MSWVRLRRVIMLVLVWIACIYVTPFVRATPLVTPHAAMLDIGAHGDVSMTVEVFGAVDQTSQLRLPSGVQATQEPSSQMSTLLTALVVPYETSEVLEFNGVLDPTQIPTLTPYRQSSPATASIAQNGTEIALQSAPTDTVYTVKLTCPWCAPEWYVAVLAQLPIHAPVLVLGNGVAACDGLWRVRAQSTQEFDNSAPARVVTLLTVQTASEIGRCTTTSAQTAEVTAPVRTVTVDGTQTLMRLVFCLVVVLLLSVGSFYGAIALTKRMHSAVGFRREDR